MANKLTYDVIVPPVFWRDHVGRDLLMVPEYSWTRKHDSHGVHLELHWVDVAELHSDASHYSSPGDFYPDLFGLCMSARATVKRLERQVGKDTLTDLAVRYKQWSAEQRRIWTETNERNTP